MTYKLVDRVVGPETFDCNESVIDTDYLTITAAVAQLNEYSKRKGFSKVLYDDDLDRYFICRRFDDKGIREYIYIDRI